MASSEAVNCGSWVINRTVVCPCVFSYLAICTFLFIPFQGSFLLLADDRMDSTLACASRCRLDIHGFHQYLPGGGTLCQHPALNRAGRWFLTQCHSFWPLLLALFNLMATCCLLGWVFKSCQETHGFSPTDGLLPTSGWVRPPSSPYYPLDISLVWRRHLDECSTVAKAGCEGLGEPSLGMFSSQGTAFKAAGSFVLEQNWLKLHQEVSCLCLPPGPCEQSAFLPGC